MLPEIYVHIPTYARFDLLAEALESVRRQTYKGDIFVCVLNDCPWQELSIGGTWRDNFHLLVCNKPERIAPLGKKRQVMLDMMKPEKAWIAFLDDDDLWMPWYLEQSLENNERYDMVSSRAVFYHRHSSWCYEDTAGGIPMLVRAETANKLGGFPPDVAIGEDNIFRNRLLAGLPADRVRINKRPGYCVRVGGQHLHTSMVSENRYMLDAEARREKGRELQGELVVQPKWVEKYDEKLKKLFPEVFPKD